MPRVSILLPVYNCAPFLKDAITSLFTQTFSDFELIAINDGSVDESLEILKSFTDSRLRIVNNGCNLGLVASLNMGIALAESEYIARHDADDVAHPDRLFKQISFLDSYPLIGLLGCAYQKIDERGKPLEIQQFPLENADLQEHLLFGNHFCHPAVMMRRSVLSRIGGYDSQFGTAEDYDLWLRLAEAGEVANLRQPLVSYRHYSSSKTAKENISFIAQNDLMAVQKAIARRTLFLAEGASGSKLRRQIAKLHLSASCRCFMLGKLDESRDHILQALEVGACDLQPEAYASFIELCVTYLATSWFGWVSGVEALEFMFTSLPPRSQHYTKHRNRILGNAYRHLAFEAHRKGDAALVRKSTARYARMEPRQAIMDRGAMSIFAQSFGRR